MKKSILLITVAAFLIGSTNVLANNITNSSEETVVVGYDFKTAFVKVLENAKAYTLEVAEAMPAEDYNFKTADSVKTFGEQLAHLAMSSMFINTKLIQGEELPESEITEEMVGASKEETIKMINMSFDSVIATLKGMTEEQLQEKFVVFFRPEKPEFTKQEGFVFLRDHITHHRGQAIVYLRMKGHDAPSYRAF